MKILKECDNCKKNSKKEDLPYIVIDTENLTITCGVRGIIEGTNIRIIKEEVICAKCNSLIYKEVK